MLVPGTKDQSVVQAYLFDPDIKIMFHIVNMMPEEDLILAVFF